MRTVLGLLLLAPFALAQPPGGFGPPRPGELFPPFVLDQLALTDAQKKTLDAIQKDVDAKLAKILTDAQKKELKEFADRRPGDFPFPGGPGPGRPAERDPFIPRGERVTPADKPRDQPKAVTHSPEAVRAAVEKALPVLWKGIDGHTAKRDCFTCHNHTVPLLALTAAKARGFDVPDKKLAEQTAFIVEGFEAMRERMLDGRGPGPAPTGGGADNTAYALFTFEILGLKPTPTTEAVATYTLNFVRRGDHWFTPAGRAPTEASDFTTTALAVRGIQKYGAEKDRERIGKRVEAVRGWLLTAKPKDTEDRVFRLLGLKAAGASALELADAAKGLLAAQRETGGWGQTDKLDADAYATGTALYALHTAAGIRTDDPAYRRGLEFLLGTQRADGSWYVPTRSRPVQRYFESGFPHEKDQFISCAATGWATAALAFDCEKK